MRILTVTRGFIPAVSFGGPAVATYEITKRLVARGYDVTVYTSNLRGDGGKLFDGTTGREVDGVHVVYFDSAWDYNGAAITPDLIRYCRREMARFDVVNIYGLREFMTLVAARSAANTGIPYILQPLGNLPRYSRSVSTKRLYDALFRDNLLRRASSVVARSELEAEQIAGFGVPASRISVVPNGVAVEEFAESSPQAVETFRERFGLGRNRLVLYVGRLATIKSVDLLIESFAALRDDSRLVLVGPEAEPDYVKRLRRMSQRLDVSRRVTFAGVLHGVDKVAAYHAADVCVLPSRLETYGLAAAEAIASGTPVVVTTGCGLAPVVHDRVGLAVPHDAPSLSAALKRLLHDDTLRASFAARTAAVARDELSWEAAVDRLESVLERVRPQLARA